MNKWQVLDKKALVSSPMFRFMEYKLKHGDKHTEHKFYILDTGDWVNIIPLTTDNQIVLVRQYRAGIDNITVEIPGGIMDLDENDPLVTARRELEEETAYIGNDFSLLGHVHPNPSFMTNTCYFVLAQNVEKKGKLHFDPSEYIETFTVPLKDIPQMIANGTITHSLSVAALGMLLMKNPGLFR